MSRSVRTQAASLFVVLVTALTIGAARASADVLLTPYLGGTFGGDTTQKQDTYGFSLGAMAAGVFGVELDVGRTGQVFGDTPLITDASVTTVTGNLLIGAPIGPVRPYVVGGLGLIRSSADALGGLTSGSETNLGVDVGGGLMGFFGEHAGARVDLRYFRNVSGGDNGVFDFNLGDFDFWRATVGVTFRF